MFFKELPHNIHYWVLFLHTPEDQIVVPEGQSGKGPGRSSRCVGRVCECGSRAVEGGCVQSACERRAVQAFLTRRLRGGYGAAGTAFGRAPFASKRSIPGMRLRVGPRQHWQRVRACCVFVKMRMRVRA
jgi:hypothetical protein